MTAMNVDQTRGQLAGSVIASTMTTDVTASRAAAAAAAAATCNRQAIRTRATDRRRRVNGNQSSGTDRTSASVNDQMTMWGSALASPPTIPGRFAGVCCPMIVAFEIKSICVGYWSLRLHCFFPAILWGGLTATGVTVIGKQTRRSQPAERQEGKFTWFRVTWVERWTTRCSSDADQ